MNGTAVVPKNQVPRPQRGNRAVNRGSLSALPSTLNKLACTVKGKGGKGSGRLDG
jgi:hypothetical protein